MKKSNFWIYALSASIYFGQGIENLPFLPFFFYMKETLGLDESRIMFLSAWITVAWLIKPLIGYVIDSSKFSKKIWIIGSLLGSLVFATLLGLITYLPLVWLIIFMAIASTNTAIRDVGVDGVMCVEGKKANITGKIQCFDDKTEILTNNGWKSIDTIKNDDLAFSMDIKTNQASYYPINNIFKYNYSGELFQIKKNNCEFLFSPEHRLLYKFYNQNLKFSTMEYCSNFQNSKLEIPKTCIWNEGKIVSDFQFKYKNNIITIKLDDWLEFLGWFVSEGFLHSYNDNEFGISQKKIENRQKLERLFQRIGLSYWTSHPTDFLFSIHSIFEYLKIECYQGFEVRNGQKSVHNCYNKKVPSFIKNLPSEKIQIFLDAFNKGDGWKSWNNQNGYFTTSLQLKNDLEELIIKSNKSFTTWEINKPNYHVGWRIEEKSSKNYIVNIAKNVKKIFYSGRIWDVETNPHHTLLIKRNGHIMWTGNSVQWGFITVASVMTGFVGGYLAEHYNYQVGYLILIPIYLIIIAIVTQYNPSKIVTKSSINLRQTLKELFTDKRLLLVCLFLFLYKFSPAFGTPLTFILKDKFMWSKQFIGTMDTISAAVGLIGAFLYFHYSKRLNLRKWLITSVFVGAIVTLCYLYFTPVTAIIYNILFSVISMFISLLILDFMARNTKKGLESTSFALLCSISNLASTCNSFTGSFLFPIIGLQWLIVISAVASFACLPIIPYLKGVKNV